MKNKLIKPAVTLLIVSAFIFSSCSLFSSDDSNAQTVYTLTIDPELHERSAVPSFSTTAAGYVAYAYNGTTLLDFTSGTTLSFTFTTLPDSITVNVYAYSSSATYSSYTKSTLETDAKAASYASGTISVAANSFINASCTKDI